MVMTREDTKRKFAEIRTWIRGEQRAPHKPLLVLYALGKLQQGKRWLDYGDNEEKLIQLLAEFGPPRRSYHENYPFVRLVNDGVWRLNEAMDTKADQGSGFLRQGKIFGGFTQEILDAFAGDPSLAGEIAAMLLEQNFPETMHEDILEAVGLTTEPEYAISRQRRRDPGFRDRILQAYGYRCAVCGFDVRLGTRVIALEAAHIKWHQAGGPDIEQNGIAMCAMHHKLFDRGAFTLGDSLEFLVSEAAHGTSGLDEWLLRYHGTEIRSPQSPVYLPGDGYLAWHVREVFRGSARYQAG